LLPLNIIIWASGENTPIRHCHLDTWWTFFSAPPATHPAERTNKQQQLEAGPTPGQRPGAATPFRRV